MTHILSSREDRTTDTDEAAIAAEPIQGCRTRPAGINTPGGTAGEDNVIIKAPFNDDFRNKERLVTCSDWNPQQVVDEGEDEVDPDPSYSLLGQLDARHHVQQVVLQREKPVMDDH